MIFWLFLCRGLWLYRPKTQMAPWISWIGNVQYQEKRGLVSFWTMLHPSRNYVLYQVTQSSKQCPNLYNCLGQGCPNSESPNLQSLAPTCLNTPAWKFLVCLVRAWLASSGVFIRVGAKLCRTPALQDWVWTALVYFYHACNLFTYFIFIICLFFCVNILASTFFFLHKLCILCFDITSPSNMPVDKWKSMVSWISS